MKKLIFLLLTASACYSQTDSITPYQRQRAEAQQKKVERLAKIQAQTDERAKRLGFATTADYYAWQEARNKGKDQTLDGMKAATFGATKCGISRAAAKESKKAFKRK